MKVIDRNSLIWFLEPFTLLWYKRQCSCEQKREENFHIYRDDELRSLSDSSALPETKAAFIISVSTFSAVSLSTFWSVLVKCGTCLVKYASIRVKLRGRKFQANIYDATHSESILGRQSVRYDLLHWSMYPVEWWAYHVRSVAFFEIVILWDGIYVEEFIGRRLSSRSCLSRRSRSPCNRLRNSRRHTYLIYEG